MGTNAEELLELIFKEILPEYGMNLRTSQKELSMEMFRALQDNRLALCEAEVGTGKTHAYLLALAVYNKYSGRKIPAVISTSTIALQKALTEEYIPQISGILMAHRVIDRPLSFVVRKGKQHYVCDFRLKVYEASVRNLNREGDAGLALELARLKEQKDSRLDLDNSALTPYVKDRINVFRCSRSCPGFLVCRFMDFQKRCMTDSFDFQITNHNYILADIIGQKQGRKPLFPCYGAMVLDESHKFADAARQMYTTTWKEQDVERLISMCGSGRRTGTWDEQAMLQGRLAECNRQMFGRLAEKLADCRAGEGSRMEIKIAMMEKSLIRHMMEILEQLPLSCQKCSGQQVRLQKVKRHCLELSDKLNVFRNSANFICWAEKRGDGRIALCAVPIKLEKALFRDIWNRSIPAIITSGTLSVRGDFAHFKKRSGLQYAAPFRILETSKQSPFDFWNNALLYVPERMPFPNVRNSRYIDAVMSQILRLVSATHGHTLILFTSYWLMEKVFYCLREQISEYPLFFMGADGIIVSS